MFNRLLCLIDIIINKIKRNYYKRIFLVQTGNLHVKNCKVYGRVNVLNCNISIKENITIFQNVTFFGDGEISIGNNVAIGQDCVLYASEEGGIRIGDDVMIAAHCYIIDCNHGTNLGVPICKQKNVVEKINIGNDVWIADGCTITKGSQLENGVVIGAKSLVNNIIEKNAIAVGIPARVIKKREA